MQVRSRLHSRWSTTAGLALRCTTTTLRPQIFGRGDDELFVAFLNWYDDTIYISLSTKLSGHMWNEILYDCSPFISRLIVHPDSEVILRTNYNVNPRGDPTQLCLQLRARSTASVVATMCRLGSGDLNVNFSLLLMLSSHHATFGFNFACSDACAAVKTSGIVRQSLAAIGCETC